MRRLALIARSARAAAARRRHPLRPPLDMPDRIQALSVTPRAAYFITGNGLAARCRYVLNYGELTINEEVDNEWWFCKADWLEYFFRKAAPHSPYVLFSHNSDRPIRRPITRYLRRRNLRAWFAANVAFRHPKLFAIPLGVANPVWPHGDTGALRTAQKARIEKSRLFDVSFRVETNPRERVHCLAQTGLDLDPPTSFTRYLERLSSAYFCIAPRGNGIDTHRTWEALYLGTVPVVTRSVLTDQHPDLPLVVLDDWSQFRSIDFGPDLYAKTWGDWNAEQLRLDTYLDRVRARLEGFRG